MKKGKGLYLTHEELKTVLGWAKTVYSEFGDIGLSETETALETKLRAHLKDNNL